MQARSLWVHMTGRVVPSPDPYQEGRNACRRGDTFGCPYRPATFRERQWQRGFAAAQRAATSPLNYVVDPAAEGQGEAAQADGHGPEACPYALDTAEWWAWQRGWWSAEYDRLICEPPGPAPSEADGLDALIDWHARVFAHAGHRGAYIGRMVADLRMLERRAA